MPNIDKLTSDRTALISSIIASVEQAVEESQREMLQDVITDFVDKLDKDDLGNIKNTAANRQKVGLLDSVFATYTQDSAIKVIDAVVGGVSELLDFNAGYYSNFAEKDEIAALLDTTRATIEDWLGITAKGQLVENGYLTTLLNDRTIKNTIQDSVFRSIISGKGYNEVKKDLSTFIDGNKVQAGALEQYYRNFVYDAFSQIDRTQAKIFADKLGFNYAIYEGGLIKTSRPFCRERNGKVFSREEIAAFDPPTAKEPNYDPFTDLGGYGCRHHLNWIPDAVAFSLRPELEKAA